MQQNTTNPGSSYRIRLKETLDPSAVEWFGEISLIHLEQGETLLTGWFADQPALRGLMDELWNLNFTILGLERIEEKQAADSAQAVGLE